MPEMPEVETVRRTLEPLIKGKIISNVTIWYDKIIVNDADLFQRKVVGQKILAIDRYGCLLYTSPSTRDRQKSRMPSSA